MTETAALGRGRLQRLLAVLVALPTALHLLGRGGEGWPLVAAAFLAPLAVWRLAGRSPSRVYATAIAFGFVVPQLPIIAGLFGFSLERVLFEGALATLLWTGALRGPGPGSDWLRLARTALGAWAAWAVGSAAYALWVSFPAGAPWVVDSFRAVLFDPLGFGSVLDAAYPLARLSLRLEVVALAWVGLELAARDPGLRRELARWLPLVLVLGIGVNLLAALVGASGNELPLAKRLDGAFDRTHRPLNDRNSLGSALVLMLPVVLWTAGAVLVNRRSRGEPVWARHRPAGASPGADRPASRRPGPGTAAGGALAGLALLGLTSSMSAFLGVGVALLFGASFVLWIRGPRARVGLVALLAAVVAVELGVQALPDATVRSLLGTRYLGRAVRLVRLDTISEYLRANRFAIWSGATGMLAEAPLAGVGLGRFPRRLADFHDPEHPGFFNPIQENAHNQYLQWAAEEGLVGLVLGLGVLALAIAGGLRAMRRPPPLGSESPVRARLEACAWTAGLVGLLANLLVGHALLVPAMGGLFAAWVGVTAAAGARPAPARAEREREAAGALLGPARWALPLLAVLGAAPALLAARDPLERYQLGCFPWVFQRQADPRNPDRSRMLAPDARWFQRWGRGERMLVPVKGIVSPHVPDGRQTLTAWVDGELRVEGFELPRKQPHEATNPFVLLVLDRPADKRAGDLVELRVTCDPPYSESKAWGLSQAIVGPRQLPPKFKTPR